MQDEEVAYEIRSQCCVRPSLLEPQKHHWGAGHSAGTPPIKPLSKPAPQMGRALLLKGFPECSAIIPAPAKATRPVAVRIRPVSKVART